MLTHAADNPPCIHCGLCREVCPVFTILRTEHVGPRGLAILAEEQIATDVFYKCTLCRACREVCPVNHDPMGEHIRSDLVARDVETEPNRTMIENIREHGNPFGLLSEGEIPKTLTCC